MFAYLEETLKRDPDYLDRRITEKEAAIFIAHTIRALQNWRLRGGGPKYFKGQGKRGSVRYCRRDLLAWMDGNSISSTSEVSYE
ncbi:MAG: hypothetical protein V7727_16555 [Sneathiella sp.]